MDYFTDVPKVLICSSDIDGETLEAVWIVTILAITAAITVIVGWVRNWRRRSRRRRCTFRPSVYSYRRRSDMLRKDSFRIQTDRKCVDDDISCTREDCLLLWRIPTTL